MSALQFGVPQCTRCMRRLAGLKEVQPAWTVGRGQVRGKKRMPKTPTIQVRLLEDIQRFGRQGTILSVQPGRMRNVWYPHGKAEYLSTDELRALGIKRTTILERDSGFGIRQSESDSDAESKGGIGAGDTNLELLSPARATEVVSILLPPSLVFYRTPITQQISTKKDEAKDAESTKAARAVSAAAADLAAASIEQDSPRSSRTGIYGSVATTDIAASIRALLQDHEEGSRVVLGPDDIQFIGETAPEDSKQGAPRLKTLGTFDIEIKLKGTEKGIRRGVDVQAADSTTSKEKDKAELAS